MARVQTPFPAGGERRDWRVGRRGARGGRGFNEITEHTSRLRRRCHGEQFRTKVREGFSKGQSQEVVTEDGLREAARTRPAPGTQPSSCLLITWYSSVCPLTPARHSLGAHSPLQNAEQGGDLFSKAGLPFH